MTAPARKTQSMRQSVASRTAVIGGGIGYPSSVWVGSSGTSASFTGGAVRDSPTASPTVAVRTVSSTPAMRRKRATAVVPSVPVRRVFV